MEHLPKKFFQDAQIFYETVERKRGSYDALTQWPTYEVKIFLRVNLSYEPKKHIKT